MMRRMMAILALLLALEVGWFYANYRDVVLLNRPTQVLVTAEDFPDLAMRMLAREHISRRMLERVAILAHERGDAALRVQALTRIVASAPDEARARLRLAEALRGAGRLEEAEHLYRQELRLSGGER